MEQYPIYRRGHRPRTAFNDLLHGQFHKFKSQNEQKNEQIQIFSQDGVRKLRCKTAPTGRSTVVLTTQQLEAIKQTALEVEEKSNIEKQAERKKRIEKEIKERDKIREEYRRKEERHRNLQREKQIKMMQNPLQTHDIKINEIENLEETKEFNKLVLGIKCHAIRDAQVKEKEQIHRQEKKLNEKYAFEMKKTLEEGLKRDAEKERLRQEAMDLVAIGLASQIREQRLKREKEFSRRRQIELKMAKKRNQEFKEEREKQEKQRQTQKTHQRIESKKIKEEIKHKRQQERKLDKLENMRILKEQIEKQKKEDEMKAEEELRRKSYGRMQDLIVIEKEKEIKETKRRTEIKKEREKEEEERQWRLRVLEEAKMKKVKKAKESEDRKLQVIMKKELKMQQKLREMKENEATKNHSIITEEREHRDTKRNDISKKETKERLQEQIKMRSRMKAEEAEISRREKLNLLMSQHQEKAAFENFKNLTINELREKDFPSHLLEDLERRARSLKFTNKKT